MQRLLRDLASTQTTAATSSPASSTFQYSELSSLPLLPADIVLKTLKLAKRRPQRFFLEFPVLNLQRFTELCQKVYFPTEEYSIATWITVHCGLFYLFLHCDKNLPTELGTTTSEIEECRQRCASNADEAVQRLRLCTEPTLDTIEALVLAA
ncbi:MAG: hypothetical protein M1823_007856, partial [Watsoniomyces obsoletus]